MITAQTVKVVRAYFGITQVELAERMGVSTSLVSAVEKGTKRYHSLPSGSNVQSVLQMLPY